MDNKLNTCISISELFYNNSSGLRYIIPNYQRPYEWDEQQIQQLIDDIVNAKQEHCSAYFLGTIVLGNYNKDNDIIEIVDGQQRLTTLLYILQHNTTPNFHLYNSNLLDKTMPPDKRLQSIIDDILEEHKLQSNDDLFSFLKEHVYLFQTVLPANTDLNRYFEIMNSRGQQLQPQDVVKAYLMEQLEDENERSSFSVIWDACSDMDGYVQDAFPEEKRTELFGDSWNSIPSIQKIERVFTRKDSQDDTIVLHEQTILNIINTDIDIINTDITSEYSSPPLNRDRTKHGIVSFPTFLLHVLNLIQTKNCTNKHSNTSQYNSDSAIPNENHLIRKFKEWTKTDNIMEFAYSLLHYRALLDSFVIKTTDTPETWAICRYSKSMNTSSSDSNPYKDDSSRMILLQSMLRVTFTDQRRVFISPLLEHIDDYYENIDHDNQSLQKLFDSIHEWCRSTLCKQLSNDGNNDLCQAICSAAKKGTGTSHFLMNMLDYLIWDAEHSKNNSSTCIQPLINKHKDILDKECEGIHQQIFDNFQFRYRNSIEHFFPQNPSSTTDRGEESEVSKELRDNIGNLCMMTRSENSRRGNLFPSAKVEQYSSSDQSLKFHIMAALLKKEETWNNNTVKKHATTMHKLLQEFLSCECDSSNCDAATEA